jgi:putative ABC transport system permease protein
MFLMLTAEGVLVTAAGALLGLAAADRRQRTSPRPGCWSARRGARHALPGSEELALIAGAVIATGLLASLVPGWRAWRMSLADGLTPRN